MTIDKKIEKIYKKTFDYSFCCGGDYCLPDENGSHDESIKKDIMEYTSKIKQLILKEIMKNAPTKLPDPNPYGKWVSILCKRWILKNI